MASAPTAFGKKVLRAIAAAEEAAGPLHIGPGFEKMLIADAFGTVFSVCTSGDEVSLTMTDADTDRALDFGGPFDVPVRDGALTMVVGGSIDGETGKSLLEVLVAGGVI